MAATCPSCGAEITQFMSRKTNEGNLHCRELVHWLNSQTAYEAFSERAARQIRASGVQMRPDIKIVRKDAIPGTGFIFVERQEQNTTGTGAEKIANKIQKALNALRDRAVNSYYIVLAGKRVDLLQRVAEDTFALGGAYPHERLFVMDEQEFKERALAERL